MSLPDQAKRSKKMRKVKENTNQLDDLQELAKLALNQAEERYRTLIESLNEGVILVNAQDVIEYVNKRFTVITGFEPSEAIGKKVGGLLISSKESLMVLHQQNEWRKKGVGGRYELQIVTKNGGARWVQCSGTPLMDDDQKITGSIATLTDVTKRKKAEQELVQSEERNSAILKAIPDMMFRVNKNCQFLDFTVNNEKELNIHPSQFIGKSFEEIWPKEVAALHKGKVKKAIDTGEIVTYEYEMTNLKNQVNSFEARIVKIRGDEVLSLVRNISEKKHLERQVINTVIETQENERKRIANDLHDGLGQTLTAVNMHFNALKRRLNISSEIEKELFFTTSGLLSKAMAETREISHNLSPITLQKFGLGHALNEMVDNLNNVGKSFHIELINTLEGRRLSPQIELTFYRAVQEIINNAIKHSDANQLIIEVEVRNANIYLFTKDDGIGFDLTKSTTNGLGLQSLQNRVNSIYGKVKMSSKKGKGTVYKIQAPIPQEKNQNKTENND